MGDISWQKAIVAFVRFVSALEPTLCLWIKLPRGFLLFIALVASLARRDFKLFIFSSNVFAEEFVKPFLTLALSNSRYIGEHLPLVLLVQDEKFGYLTLSKIVAAQS